MYSYEFEFTGPDREALRVQASSILGTRGNNSLGWDSPYRTWGSDKWKYSDTKPINPEAIRIFDGLSGIKVKSINLLSTF